MNIIRELNIFKNILSIEEISKGYPKRKKYIVKTIDKLYFVKIIPYKIEDEEVEKTKWIYKTYQENKIPVIPLLDIKAYENKTIYIYPFFEGKDLKENILTREEYKNYGKLVANEVKKMNQITDIPKEFKLFNLEKHCNDCIHKIDNLMLNEKYQEKIYRIFSKKELHDLKLRLKEILNDIKHDKMMLNHNDIKLANIMIDKNGKFYFVDIEPINLTPIGFNLNYSIYTFIYPNTKDSQTFLRSFINTIDREKSLKKEWEYFIISDFINELSKLIDKDYEMLLKDKERINDILFNNNHYLEKILYYH